MRNALFGGLGIVVLAVAALTACSGCVSRGAREASSPPASTTAAAPPAGDGSGARSVAHAAQAGPKHPPTSLPVPVAPRLVGNGVAHLSWARPTKLDYGKDAATDPVAGYRIYAGPRPDALQLEAQLPDPRATGYVMRRLPKGRFWFTVTTYTRLGVESERPPPVAKLVR